EGMLRVDEGCNAPFGLASGDGKQRQRGLARRLGAIDLHHPPPWQAAAAEGAVHRQGAGGDHLDGTGRLAQDHQGALAKLLANPQQHRRQRSRALAYLRLHPLHCGHGSLLRSQPIPWSIVRKVDARTTSSIPISSRSSRSAMVRATRISRSKARADSSQPATISARQSSASREGRHASRTRPEGMAALTRAAPICGKRESLAAILRRAARTRSRTSAEDSPAGPASSSAETERTSTCMSIRSRRGPDTRARYRRTDSASQLQREGSTTE